MAAAVGSGDSPDRHLADTLAAGAGLVDRAACRIMCREVPDRVRDLVELGCGFDRVEDGTLHLAWSGSRGTPSRSPRSTGCAWGCGPWAPRGPSSFGPGPPCSPPAAREP